ncbi:MAG: AbrB/MazE/SpoVT family DNA-binding domain-containing protein [Solobacterium sp.]|nr:AbrB/MazE/SpoVT family DNA-binding domain-containing protein [Solobacterium sp.]
MEYPEGKRAWTVTVGTKGQIVLPKEAREMFSIQPGDQLIILGDLKRGLAIPTKESFQTYFSHIFSGGEQQ